MQLKKWEDLVPLRQTASQKLFAKVVWTQLWFIWMENIWGEKNRPMHRKKLETPSESLENLCSGYFKGLHEHLAPFESKSKKVRGNSRLLHSTVYFYIHY